jgi:phage gp36-like protein
MAYASVSEFVEEVTEAEARALAPNGATYDDARISDALDKASAEIDTYLAGRYSLPLDVTPLTVKTAAIDLARERLDKQGRDFVVKAAARDRAWLKDVSTGKAVIGGGQAGVDLPTEPPASSIQVAAPDRVFNDDTLARFNGVCP